MSTVRMVRDIARENAHRPLGEALEYLRLLREETTEQLVTLTAGECSRRLDAIDAAIDGIWGVLDAATPRAAEEDD